jgi:hypothetical protein
MRINAAHAYPQWFCVLGKHTVIALLWAALMVIGAAIHLYFRELSLDSKTDLLILFFGIGGLLGYGFARALLVFIPKSWTTTQRFAAAFLSFSLLTIGFTALAFALQFRIYFAQWHDDEFSKRLILETIFTMLSAVYQFLVLGLRLYLPIGIAALFGLSTLFALKRI